jgi:integrase
MLDLRQKQYFKDEESFHRGMKILQQYLKKDVDNLSFTQMEDALFELIDDTTNDMDLLERSINYHHTLLIEQGKDPYSKQLTALTSLVEKIQSSTEGVTGKTVDQGVPLEVAFDEFLTFRRESWKENGGYERKYKESYLPILRELFGTLRTGELTKNHVIELMKILQRIPRDRNKIPQFKNLSLRDFLTVDVPKEKLLKPITLGHYVTNIGSFFKWLKTVDYTQIDLESPLKTLKIKKTRSNEQKNVFLKTDLKKLFNSKQYLQGLHKKPSHFWVPLIGIYTGARLNEICQLSIKDVHEDKENKCWVFDINQDPDDDKNKSIKGAHHTRFVPIHQDLIKLGFIDFYKRQKSKKETRIFPELPYVRDANKYGSSLQRWFNRTYKNSCGIKTDKTSFHSLRHTVITHLVNEKGVDPNKLAVGMGQTPEGGVTQKTYTKNLSFKEYKKFFDLIDFSDSFIIKDIRRWDYHQFNRT